MTQDNQWKPLTKNSTTKTKKYIGKWYEFHKSLTHNTSQCHSKKPVVIEMKALELDACSNSKLNHGKGNDKGKHIYVEPSAIISTTKVQNIKKEDPKEQSVSSTHRCG